MVKISTYTFLKKVIAAMVLSTSLWTSSFCMDDQESQNKLFPDDFFRNDLTQAEIEV